MKKVRTGGGFPAVRYAMKKAAETGQPVAFIRALSSKNACKTCALGMGGQQGGMVDESGHFPEVCKKSMQAMAADMQPAVDVDAIQRGGFDWLRSLTPYELEHLGRLAQPMLAREADRGYQPVSWKAALEWCAQRFRATRPAQNFFYASGRSSNEAAFLLQLFARLYGTNNVNNCSYYCHQASGVGLSDVLGSGTATIVLEDLRQADMVFLIGGNPASNHPRLMRMLAHLRRRGGEVVVVNPLKETGLVDFSVPSDLRSLTLGSPIAGEYLQPHIGGDIAVLSGIAKVLLEAGHTDTGFIRNFTEGFDEFDRSVRALSWPHIEAASGVTRGQLERVAQKYARSRRAVFAWTMGITHHLHGVDNVRMIANLALLRGMVGKGGAGLLPIRGHSNVQGVGSVGVTPKLKQQVFDAIESRFGVTLPSDPGMDTLSCVEAMRRGEIQSAWCLGGNLFGATPDSAAAEEAFSRLDSVCYFSTTLNTGHAFGRAKETLVLPMLARDEEAQATTQESMFNFVRLSDGGPKRLQGPRSEVETIARIARSVLGDEGPVDWSSMAEHRTIRRAIAAVVPGYGEIGTIDETKKEFHIAGRTFHEPLFQTKSGRARFHAVAIPEVPASRGRVETGSSTSGALSIGLILMTIRSEGQFNTVVYEEHDLYRHQDRRDVVLLSAADVERIGIATNDRVDVVSDTGRIDGVLARPFDIPPGNAAMYFPEANVLVPSTADRRSRTPAYKAIPVRVSRSRSSNRSPSQVSGSAAYR